MPTILTKSKLERCPVLCDIPVILSSLGTIQTRRLSHILNI